MGQIPQEEPQITAPSLKQTIVEFFTPAPIKMAIVGLFGFITIIVAVPRIQEALGPPPVPNVVDEWEDVAKPDLEFWGYLVIVKYENPENCSPGRVTRQDPLPDTFIDFDSEMLAVIHVCLPDSSVAQDKVSLEAGPLEPEPLQPIVEPELVEIPPVQGMSEPSAKALLVSLGLQYLLEYGGDDCSQSGEGYYKALNTDPSEGTKVELGTKVGLYICWTSNEQPPPAEAEEVCPPPPATLPARWICVLYDDLHGPIWYFQSEGIVPDEWEDEIVNHLSNVEGCEPELDNAYTDMHAIYCLGTLEVEMLLQLEDPPKVTMFGAL